MSFDLQEIMQDYDCQIDSRDSPGPEENDEEYYSFWQVIFDDLYFM